MTTTQSTDQAMASPRRPLVVSRVSTTSDGAERCSAPKSENQLKERRKRNCTRKTRTGCLTCKKRRIRCDEHKPQCWNCLKSKERICEGYQPIKLEEEVDSPFQIYLETSFKEPSSSTASKSTSRESIVSTTSPDATGSQIPHIPWFRDAQHTPPSSASSDKYKEEPSYFAHQPYGSSRSPYTGAGFAAPILTSPLSDSEAYCTLAPMRNNTTIDETINREPDETNIPAAETTFEGPPRPPASLRTKSVDRTELVHLPPARSLMPLVRSLDSTPFESDPQAAKSFAFYMSHSGAAMGARSSDLFFLHTIPQVAGQYDFVRYALLATSLVDESVDDTHTDQSRQGPGIECVNVNARRLSFEMYGRSLRALCDAQSIQHATLRDSDNALAAMLITCILLFGFENWLWNVQNAGRHIEGAQALVQSYERTQAGREKRSGLLHDQVLIMVGSAIKYHDMSLQLNMPASRCTEGPVWAPQPPLVTV